MRAWICASVKRMSTRSSLTCSASMSGSLIGPDVAPSPRLGPGVPVGRRYVGADPLDDEGVAAPGGAEVAGQVDPLLAVPVGDERVEGEDVVVEELSRGCAGREGGEAQDASPE